MVLALPKLAGAVVSGTVVGVVVVLIFGAITMLLNPTAMRTVLRRLHRIVRRRRVAGEPLEPNALPNEIAPSDTPPGAWGETVTKEKTRG